MHVPARAAHIRHATVWPQYTNVTDRQTGQTTFRYSIRRTVTCPRTNATSIYFELQCGLMPNVMAALSNIGGALCESLVVPLLVPRRKVWLTPAAGVPCGNAANIRKRKIWTEVNFAHGKTLSGARAPPRPGKCIYSV